MNDEIKRIDQEGENTLKTIAEADKFIAWMYDLVCPYAGGKILEIVRGIGNISAFFIKDGNDITLTNVRAQYTEQLARVFLGRPLL